MKPVKHAVAVMIRRESEILAIRRSEHDDELPGVWGLPAGTVKGTETIEEVIRRIGRDKLGVALTPVRRLAEGSQSRPKYELRMDLWEVSMDGTPTYPEWRWADLDLLKPGMTAGSLCCELALKTEKPR